MKRKSPCFFLFVVVLYVLTFAIPVLANASTSVLDTNTKSVEYSAKNAVEAFFDAGSHKDFNTMASNSIDSQNTLSVHRQIFDKQIEDFLGYQIKSVQKVDSTHATAIVEIREKHLTATMKYPVVFNGTKWLIDIANAENIVQDSSKGQKIVQPSSKDQKIVQPCPTFFGFLSYFAK